MNEIQFLTKDQINGIMTILETEHVIPKINKAIELVKSSNEYKEAYNKVKDTYTKCNKLLSIFVFEGDKYFSLEEETLERRTLKHLKVNTDNWDLKHKILAPLKARLQLLSVGSDFDTIINTITKYIKVDDYL